MALGEPHAAALLRKLLLVLAALGIAGTAVELVLLRHWESEEQIAPWLVLVVAAVAVGAVALRPTRTTLKLARLVAMGTAVAGLYGMVEHVVSNHDAGPLDRNFSATWDTMSAASQWWQATTGGVGPSPLLAPAVLVQIALCLYFATLAHPALASLDEPVDTGEVVG